MGKCCITEVKRSSPVCEKTFDLLREQGVGGIAFRQALPYQHCSKNTGQVQQYFLGTCRYLKNVCS